MKYDGKKSAEKGEEGRRKLEFPQNVI